MRYIWKMNCLAPVSFCESIMKKFYITTLGCKVNQFESAAFKSGLEEAGLQPTSGDEQADLVIVNTCAVTSGAGAQSRQSIRKCLRRNPEAKIIITGCYAEIDAQLLAAIDELKGRDYSIIGNCNKDQVVALATRTDFSIDQMLLGEINKAKKICDLPVKRFGERSRAYLRIQDGCESFCSYCIVPYTRGPSRSLPVSRVLEQAAVFAEQGHREIVLTGIHLGNYGKDLEPAVKLVDLLQMLAEHTPEVSYRISSLEPLEIDTRLLELMRSKQNIQPHFHIPLQSGHNSILKRMARRYTTEQFSEVIKLCHSKVPDLSIGIDILAGFPGETEEQFNEAVTFLQSLNFAYLHVFPYSRRPGTIAADLPGQIPKPVKEHRVAELLRLSQAKQRNFHEGQLKKTRQVLVEGRRDKQGRLKGFTDNYIDVRFSGPASLLNDICMVKLLTIENNFVIGERHEYDEN